MSEHTYKPGDRVRLVKHPDVEGLFFAPAGRPDHAKVKLNIDESMAAYSIVMSFDAIEPVPPPTFDPAELRVGDIVDAPEGHGPFIVRSPNVRGYTIERAWRLDESGDYRLIFPPREVQR